MTYKHKNEPTSAMKYLRYIILVANDIYSRPAPMMWKSPDSMSGIIGNIIRLSVNWLVGKCFSKLTIEKLRGDGANHLKYVFYTISHRRC